MFCVFAPNVSQAPFFFPSKKGQQKAPRRMACVTSQAFGVRDVISGGAATVRRVLTVVSRSCALVCIWWVLRASATKCCVFGHLRSKQNRPGNGAIGRSVIPKAGPAKLGLSLQLLENGWFRPAPMAPFLALRGLLMGSSLQILRSNRRGLRKLGLTSQALECVETYFALKAKRPRVSLADVGRVLGVSRQLVHRHIVRAEAVGLIVRFGRSILLCAKSLLRWSDDFVLQRAKAYRDKTVKRWKTLLKSGCVNTGLTHTVLNTSDEMSETYVSLVVENQTRQEAADALKRMYVPPHLRKAQ